MSSSRPCHRRAPGLLAGQPEHDRVGHHIVRCRQVRVEADFEPGAGAYTGPDRNRFRATVAHNTVEVDEESQYVLWGDFRGSDDGGTAVRLGPRARAVRGRGCDRGETVLRREGGGELSSLLTRVWLCG
jgi:Heparinase II/III-like protein